MKITTILLLSISLGIASPNQAQVNNQSKRGPSNGSSQKRLTTASLTTTVTEYTVPNRSSRQKPNPAALARISQLSRASGDWGGTGCPSSTTLKLLVDEYLASPSPQYPELGGTVPGMSTSWSSPTCGTFSYAVGLRNIELNQQITPGTRMGIGSMSKAIIAAITLKLSEQGAFSPKGLDSTVDTLLSSQQLMALTVGDDPLQPRCPGFIYLLNRETYNFEWTAFSCPDLSRVTLRDLMRGNHGMYDFINEVVQPSGFTQYEDSFFFELYQALGLSPTPPVNSTHGFDYLKAYGLKQSNIAVVGGSRLRDFEISLGNTGFQLLGIILEEKTGKSLDELIKTLIVEPLKLDPISVYVEAAQLGKQIADGYDVYTGEPLIEQTGIYPIVNLNGHTAVNTLAFGLGQPGNLNLAGGAGGLIANPKSYRVFLNAFVNGGLLGPQAQSELDSSFIQIVDLGSPESSILNGYGVAKIKLRGFSGVPDVDLITHAGSLPGVRCEDAVLFSPDSSRTLATGVICQNSNREASDPFFLNLEFITAIVNPGP